MIFVIIFVASFFCKVYAANEVSGLRISSLSSFACNSFPISSLENTQSCMFVRITSSEGTIVEMEETANNFTFSIEHKETLLNVKLNEAEKLLQRRSILKRWMKICVIIKTPRQVTVAINHVQETFSIEPDKEEEADEGNAALEGILRTDGNDTLSLIFNLCIGNRTEDGKSFLGEVTGLQVYSAENASDILPKCLNLLAQDFENFKLWNELRHIFFMQNDILPICMNTQSIYLENSYLSYLDQTSKCTSLKGRLLMKDEAKYFQRDLQQMSETICGNGRANYDIFGTWVESQKSDITSLEDQCTVYGFDDKSSQQSCIVESFCNCCIFPYHISIRMFGPASKFDRLYTLYVDKVNNIRTIYGSNSSEIIRVQNKWILRSKLHKEEWILSEEILPIGRKIWNNTKTNTTTVLTFTACLEEEFACSDGSCVSFSLRCNGVVDCKDKSDENECTLIEKMRGYKVEKIVPPEDDDEKSEITFYTFIYNIADISAINGKMVINIANVFYWKDTRLKFRNPKKEDEIDCDTIWSPVVEMTDGFPNGMIVSHKMYRLTCRIDHFIENSESYGKISANDPYMGRLTDGKDVVLYQFYAAEATLYCRFDLRKYPFGKQVCTLNIWSDHNSLSLKDYKFVSHSMLGNKSKIKYRGRKELGEYFFVDSYYEIVGSEDKILISIVLQTLYGYHILNSFTPSFLICIISLGTLLFPLTDFNERIMVSLTSLLVLAALFTQASETSIKTSYFKYIDIWYVTLITFSFFIVITNIGLRIYKKKEEEHIINIQIPKYDVKAGKDEYTFKNTMKLNRLAIILYTIILTAFITVYILLSKEYI